MARSRNSQTSQKSEPGTHARKKQVPEVELLQAVLERIGSPQWDLLIVGDGSGAGWDTACGWCGVLIDNQTRLRKILWGAMNIGSVNSAESLPYLQALSWFDAKHGRERLRARGILNVHIITDSKVIATWGTKAMSPAGDLPRANVAYWAAMREFRRLGYHCHFHWANRSTTQLNWTADLIAGMARRELQAASKQVEFPEGISQRALQAVAGLQFANPETGEPIDIYHLNPTEEHTHVSNAIHHTTGRGHPD